LKSHQPTPGKIIVAAAIFDLDGTIIDSVGIYRRIVDATLDRLSLPPVSMVRLRDAAENDEFDWLKVFPEEIDPENTDLIQTAWAVVAEISPKMFSDAVALIPGTAEILTRIAQSGKILALVTSTPQKSMPPKIVPLVDAGIHHLFAEIITLDDAARRKPAADPLIECLKRLGIAPEKSVYVGDTRVDIKAGKAAGTKTIGVLTGFDDFESIQEEQPDAIIDSITGLPSVLRI
jgi:phosphoglycolate phosphatase